MDFLDLQISSFVPFLAHGSATLDSTGPRVSGLVALMVSIGAFDQLYGGIRQLCTAVHVGFYLAAFVRPGTSAGSPHNRICKPGSKEDLNIMCFRRTVLMMVWATEQTADVRAVALVRATSVHV